KIQADDAVADALAIRGLNIKNEAVRCIEDRGDDHLMLATINDRIAIRDGEGRIALFIAPGGGSEPPEACLDFGKGIGPANGSRAVGIGRGALPAACVGTELNGA